MLRKIINIVIVAPLALIFIVFAVANRQFVTVSFDPFDQSNPALAVSLPLFVVIIGMTIVGVVAGSAVTWLRQGRHRRAARRQEAEAAELRRLLLASQQEMAETRREGLRGLQPPTALPPAA